MKSEILKVMPIFSLTAFATRELSESVTAQYDEIERLLRSKQGTLREADIALSGLPGGLKTSNKDFPIRMDEVLNQLTLTNTIAAPAPYLLGLWQAHYVEVMQQMQGAVRIELLCFPSEYSFKKRVGKTMYQLCLKKIGNRMIIDLSDYVDEKSINANIQYAANAIRTIVMPAESRMKTNEADAWENALIG